MNPKRHQCSRFPGPLARQTRGADPLPAPRVTRTLNRGSDLAIFPGIWTPTFSSDARPRLSSQRVRYITLVVVAQCQRLGLVCILKNRAGLTSAACGRRDAQREKGAPHPGAFSLWGIVSSDILIRGLAHHGQEAASGAVGRVPATRLAILFSSRPRQIRPIGEGRTRELRAMRRFAACRSISAGRSGMSARCAILRLCMTQPTS